MTRRCAKCFRELGTSGQCDCFSLAASLAAGNRESEVHRPLNRREAVALDLMRTMWAGVMDSQGRPVELLLQEALRAAFKLADQFCRIADETEVK